MLQSGTVIQRHMIVGEIGRGTTSIVYEANDIKLNRRVAFKVPYSASEPNWNATWNRFHFECVAMAQVSWKRGNGIPALYEVSESNGILYSARELVEGSTLDRRVEQSSIDFHEALGILSRIAGSLRWVHSRGFVHGNLSPENVIVGFDGSPWLIGFGFVRPLKGSPHSPPGTEGSSTDIDVRGLRQLLEWLCDSMGESIPETVPEI